MRAAVSMAVVVPMELISMAQSVALSVGYDIPLNLYDSI